MFHVLKNCFPWKTICIKKLLIFENHLLLKLGSAQLPPHEGPYFGNALTILLYLTLKPDNSVYNLQPNVPNEMWIRFFHSWYEMVSATNNCL
jgi:hypothetical protein